MGVNPEYGYASNQYGALSPDEFTFDGNNKQVTVNAVRKTTSGADSVFELGLTTEDPSVAAYWILQVGGTTLNFAEATQPSTNLFRWSLPADLDWTDANFGDKVSVSLTQGNRPPTSADKTVETDEDVAYTFAATDFAFDDDDADDNALVSVKIVSLLGDPGNTGTLSHDGTAIDDQNNLPVMVSKSDLESGLLTYTPPADANGTDYTGFTFRVNDGEADSTDTYTMTINVDSVPDVTQVAVTSEPNVDTDDPKDGTADTYGLGEKIRITATFDEDVTVTGDPVVNVEVGSNSRPAAYVSGTGTMELVFEYTVVAADSDSDGIEIAANALGLNSGTIKDSDSHDADITHDALAAQGGHKVDGSLVLPGKPTAVTVAAVDGESTQLGVSWTAPSEPATDYDYRYRKKDTDPVSDWTTVDNTTITATTVTITGLEAFTAYEAQVRAVNAVGAGDWSDVQSGMTRRAVFLRLVPEVGDLHLQRPTGHVKGTFTVYVSTNPDLSEPPAIAAFTVKDDDDADRGTVSNIRVTSNGRAGYLFDVTVEAGYEGPLNVAVVADALPGGANIAVSLPLVVDQTRPTVVISTDVEQPINIARNRDGFDVEIDLSDDSVIGTGDQDPGEDRHFFREDDISVTNGDWHQTSYTIYERMNGDRGVDIRATAESDFEGVMEIAVAANRFTDRVTNPNIAGSLTLRVDTKRPRIESIEHLTPESSPTNADSLTWRVTFTEDVKGVDLNDFTVSGTTAPLNFSEVTASRVYDLTASGGDLAGLNATVTLGLVSTPGISDTADNSLTETEPTGTDESAYVVDNTPPTVASATVNRTTLVITFNEALGAASDLANGAFEVKKTVSGTEQAVALSGAPVILDDTVTLTLASRVFVSDTDVKVSYTVPGTDSNNQIKDVAGNAAGSVTDQAVTNNTANVSATGTPMISGEVIVGGTLTAGLGTIADDDGLPATFPDDYSFQWVRQDDTSGTNPVNLGTDPTYTLVGGDLGKYITVKVTFDDGGGTEETRSTVTTGAVQPKIERRFVLTESSYTVTEGENLTVTAQMQDSNGNPAALQTDLKFILGTVGDTATGQEDYIVPDNVSTLSQGDTSIELQVRTVDDGLVEGNEIFYVRLGPSPSETPDLTTQTLMIDETSIRVTLEDNDSLPAVTAAVLAGSSLVLTFDKALDENSVPATSAFGVTVTDSGNNAIATTVSRVLVSGQTVTLTISPAVTSADDVVKVSYTPGSNPLQDTDGNDVASFTDREVDNQPEPVLALSVSSDTIAEAAGTSTVTVAITNGVTFDADQTITLSLGGTATVTDDYTIVSQSLTLMASETSVTTTVTAVQDTTDEPDETVEITATHDSTGIGSQTITITDDDNTPATGTVAITGETVVGDELTAALSGVTDEDGYTDSNSDNVPDALTWQWVRVDSGTGTDIPGATAQTYTLVDADAGKTIRVKASFTDDAGTTETLTNSTAVGPVTVNMPPTASDGTININEDGSHTFSVADFGYSDADSDPLASVKIVTVETAGDLELSNAAVTANQVIDVADIGNLVFTPAADWNGSASFTFTVNDGRADSTATYTMTVNVLNTPDLTQVAVTSMPKSGTTPKKYGAGEKIQVTATFDEDVTVTGDPVINVEVGSNSRPAAYVSSSSTATELVFEYTVVAADSDTDGISINANALTLDSDDEIKDSDSNDADITHTALVAQSNHQVDGSLNAPATGLVMTGTPSVGRTLTADVSGIRDANGLTSPSYTYQWKRWDDQTGTTSVNVGTDSSTYTPVIDDVGKYIAVTVSFMDDASNSEALTAVTANTVSSLPVRTISLSQGSYTVEEGNNLTVTVEIRDDNGALATLEKDVTLRLTSIGGDHANTGVDFVEVNEAVTIGMGDMSADVTVVTLDDELVEMNSNEVFRLLLAWEGGTPVFTQNVVMLADSVFPVTIEDDGDTLPVVERAYVAAVQPDEVVLIFDRALDTGSVPAASAFTVKVDGSAGPGVTAVAFDSTDATQVRLTLATALNAGQTGVTVDYTNPGTSNSPLRDTEGSNEEGNEVASFTDQTVVSTPPAALVFTGAPVSVTEGRQATYTVALDAAPVADVTVSLTLSGDTGAATISPASLTFTPTDWGAKTVTVTGVDDGVEDDDRTVTITHSGTGVTTGTVSVTVSDIPPAALVFTPEAVTVTEGGQARYTVALDAAPVADVTVSLTLSGDTGAATISPASLTFTPTDWGAKTVTVTGVAGDSTVTITHSGTGVTTGTVSVTVSDIPPSALVFTPETVTVIEGRQATYTVALDAAPAAEVTVSIVSDDEDAATVSPASLTFTPTDWGAKTVTVTGVDDGVEDDDRAVTITHSGTGVTTGTVSVTVSDIPPSVLVFTDVPVTVTEGGQARYTVALDAAPAAEVTVSIVSDDEDAATVSPASLTFTPTDWGAQTVTVTGVADDAEDDRAVTITHSGDGVETGTVSVTVTAESTLEAPRKEEATTLLRRHVDRFASVSSGAALGRLQGLAPPTTVNAQISARNHKLDASWNGDGAKDSGWAGWSRLFYGWVEGPGDGAVYDLYLGVDWRAPDGRYVIGGMLGHEGADLRLDEGGGRFRSRITQVGLYGATYLSETLILDGALAYGFGRPELSQGGVTAKYDTRRLTLRADLTGGLSWRDGAMVIEPQLGVLHVRENLGAFTDSAGVSGAAETLRLTRLGIGPRLTWMLPKGTFTGRARVNWDRHNLDNEQASDLSASLDARLRYDLDGGLSAEFFGAADGIGLSGDQQTYSAGVSLNFRF